MVAWLDMMMDSTSPAPKYHKLPWWLGGGPSAALCHWQVKDPTLAFAGEGWAVCFVASRYSSSDPLPSGATHAARGSTVQIGRCGSRSGGHCLDRARYIGSGEYLAATYRRWSALGRV